MTNYDHIPENLSLTYFRITKIAPENETEGKKVVRRFEVKVSEKEK